MTLNKIQCRAARALLGWSQAELADQARVTTKTVADFERGMTAPHRSTLARIAEALEDAGVQFLNGDAPGVQLTPSVAGQTKA
jgi:transcriptional regulator with XRE-family HTH domain